MKKRKKLYISGGAGAVLLLLAVLLLWFLLPNQRLEDPYGYYGITMGQTVVFYNTERVDTEVLRKEDRIYLPLSFVQENLNERFYYDVETGALLYQLPDRILTFLPNALTHTDGVSEVADSLPVYLQENGTDYLLLDTVEAYTPLSHAEFQEPSRLWLMDRFDMDIPYVTIPENTVLRTGESNKKAILTEVLSGSQAVVVSEGNSWNLVLTDRCQLGYIRKKDCSEVKFETIPAPSVEGRDYRGNLISGTVSAGFDYIDDVSYGLEVLENHIADNAYVNVMIPTWFVLQGNEGAFTSCADPAYVARAHEMGYRVWGMVENITGDVDTTALLTSRTARTTLIANLLTAVQENGLDGINIDFESLTEEVMPSYTQFLRELKAACLQNGITLSVDTYAPFSWNEKYNLPELSLISDYVIIMGYDESWNTPGPNSSLSFMQKLLEKACEITPAEQLIIAVPFYTRAWSGTEGGYQRREVYMKKSIEYLSGCADAKFDSELGCYYGTVDIDGTTCEIWFEDLVSSESRFGLISEYPVGGLAYWRLGQEDPGIWNIVRSYFPGVQ